MALVSHNGDENWKHLNLSVCNSTISERRLTNFCYLEQHVIVFQDDLSQLIKQLKHFVFLDIYGLISFKRVKSYRLMVQTRFPNSRSDVQISRFRLWV
jgi:hypothetical protein